MGGFGGLLSLSFQKHRKADFSRRLLIRFGVALLLPQAWLFGGDAEQLIAVETSFSKGAILAG